MRTRNKVIVTTVLFGVLGFALQSNGPLGQLIWPPAPGMPTPTGGVALGFMLYGVVAALGFGLGAALLLHARPWFQRLPLESGGLATAMQVSAAWVPMNFVVHDSLHQANGVEMAGLLAIEWVFHGTILLAGLILAWGLLRIGEDRSSAPSRTTT